MPKISLCMIVKNEEEMLPACLESVQGIVDEIIIVDTGSTDNTVAIAESFNAQIHHFPWINDFAAARNESCSKATGDYILILDADERLYELDPTPFEEAIAAGNFQIGLIALHQAISKHADLDDVVFGDARTGSPILLPRLLRNSPDFRYVGVVHEQPTYDGEVHFQIINANIVHHGADEDWRASRNKKERNLELLLSSVDSYGDMPIYWTYLASALQNANRHEEMIAAIEKGWEAVEKNLENGQFYSDSAIASLYPSLLISQGRVKDGVEALSKVLGRNLPNEMINPNLLYSAAYSLAILDVVPEHRDQVFSLVSEIAKICMDMRNEAFLEELLPGVVDWRAQELYAIANLRLRNYDIAIENFNSLKESRSSKELDYWLIECHIDQGSVESIKTGLNMLLPHLNDAVDPDPWILATVAAIALEAMDDARNFWENALMRVKIGVRAHHRIRMLNSIECMFSLLDGKPKAGNGVYGVLGAIIARKPLLANNPIPKFIIQQVVQNFVNKSRFDLLEPLLEPRGEQILPGISQVLNEIGQEVGIEIYDDGERSPLFVHTSETQFFQNLLSKHPNITCSENFNYHHGLIDSLWSQVVEEDFQDDFFDDSFSWLEDETIWAEDTTISEDVLLEGIGMCLSHLMDSVTEKGHHFCSISSQNKDYFDTLSKVYSRAKFIHVIEDPREVVLEKNITNPEEIKKYLLEWSQGIELIRSQCERLDQNYIEMTIPLLKKYPKEEMARLLAFLGQTWEEEVIDELANLDNIKALGTLSNDQASVIEGNIGDLLTNFGFELSPPS